MIGQKKVAIVYLCWANEPKKYLERMLISVSQQSYLRDNLLLAIVYNGPRTGENSQTGFIQTKVDEYRHLLPETIDLYPENNLGFSGGNNYGISHAIKKGADYIFLHNADGFLADNAIEEMVNVMENNQNVGECQPLMLLYPETNLINSAGNSFHYLGIGYCADYRSSVRKFPKYSEIGYVSGAAAMMRASDIMKFGYWSEDFFLYHEDTEYSLRLKLLGLKTALAGSAVFYHQYNFSPKTEKFFWIERNRHALKILFYKWPTIVLLFPLELVYNLGLIVLSLSGGWFKELIKVYLYWLNPVNWKAWLVLRKYRQKNRIITDRQLIKKASYVIGTGDLKISAPFRVGVNFIFTIYWFLIKILIWW